MNRCDHGNYIPAGDKKAYYCLLCCPEGLEALRATKPKKARQPRKLRASSPESGLSPGSDNEQAA